MKSRQFSLLFDATAFVFGLLTLTLTSDVIEPLLARWVKLTVLGTLLLIMVGLHVASKWNGDKEAP